LLFTSVLSLQQSWIMTYMTRNCLPSLKLSKFGDTTWKVWPTPSTLLWIIKILSTFSLPRCWPRDKCGSMSTSLSSILSLGFVLVILAPNQILSLFSEMSILKVLSSQTVDLVFSLFYFLFLFLFHFIFYFLFLEQLVLELISHTVTSVTI